jgi:acyl-homoserine lactone acylase PvdQ
MFALGFLHAEDRLWFMYLRARISEGVVSHFLGNEGLKIDRFIRMLNFKKICIESVQGLEPQNRLM